MPPEAIPRPADLPRDPASHWPELRHVGDRLRLRPYLRGTWARREFILEVPRGELRAQNQNTVVGNLWHLLNPLLLVVVYWLVFDLILGRSGDGNTRELLFGGSNYLGFLVAGIIPYTYSSRAMTAGARVIVKNRQMIQNITFPRVVLPLSTVLTEAYSHLPAMVVMVGLLLATGETLSWTWLLLLPLFAVQTVFNTGLGFITGRITFHFEDTLQILPYVLRLLFYVSGIIFAIDQVGASRPALATLLRLNPFAAFVELTRALTLGNIVEWDLVLIVLAWSVLTFVGGFVFFRAAEQDFGRV
jgi:teichoic acid transport system permease protein